MNGEKTKRVINPEAEKILGRTFPVLDYGFVRLIDYMGGDESVVQAARVSYGKGTKTGSEDRGLIRYLMRNNHTSPFEMVELKWHCKMPIFVARQWVRHRTASINEYSMRYSEPENDFYTPKPGEIRFQSVTNKQGGKEEEVPEEIASMVIKSITESGNNSLSKYRELSDKNIARELSRIGLPLNIYTQWYWKNDLHNTLHFLKLRMEKHAQYEIRQYANTIAEILKEIVPLTWEAFSDYVLNAVTFSSHELDILKGNFDIPPIVGKLKDMKELSKGEKEEFMEKLRKIIKI